MRILCKHCVAEFKSVDLRPDMALSECVNGMLTHYATEHEKALNKSQQAVQKAVAETIWISMMNILAKIPEDEPFPRGRVEELRKDVLGLLGLGKKAETTSTLVTS